MVLAMADHVRSLVTHGRAMEAEVARGHRRLATAAAAMPRVVVDITVGEAVVVIPVVEAEATPVADIVDTTRTGSAS